MKPLTLNQILKLPTSDLLLNLEKVTCLNHKVILHEPSIQIKYNEDESEIIGNQYEGGCFECNQIVTCIDIKNKDGKFYSREEIIANSKQ